MIENFTRSTFALIGIIVTLFLCLVLVMTYAISRSDENDAGKDVESDDTRRQQVELTLTIATPFSGTPLVPTATLRPATIAAVPPGQTIATAAPVVAQSGGGVLPTTVVVTNCTVRTDWVAYTVVAGDSLSGLAEVLGITLAELAQGNCLTTESLLDVGQVLVVPALPVSSGAVVVNNVGGGTCATTWFFTFTDATITPAVCPGGINVVEAIGQNFENGRVLWYAAPMTSTDQRGVVYVIYNTGAWEAYIDTWNSTLPASDTTIVAPTGFYQPVEAIGKVWRENINVRNALGWATAPAIAFDGRFQNPLDNSNSFYLDNGENNLVLQLSLAGTTRTWRNVGGY